MTKALPFFALIGITPLVFMAALLADFLGWKYTLFAFLVIDLESMLESLPELASMAQMLYPMILKSPFPIITQENVPGIALIMLIIGHVWELAFLHRAFHKENLWRRFPFS